MQSGFIHWDKGASIHFEQNFDFPEQYGLREHCQAYPLIRLGKASTSRPH